MSIFDFPSTLPSERTPLIKKPVRTPQVQVDYGTKAGERLDEIVMRHYGTVEMLERVLSANPHLSSAPVLSAGMSLVFPRPQTPSNNPITTPYD